MSVYSPKDFKINFTVNVLDGGFFGFALGFSSFVTVLPLFLSNLTDSAILIGLIPALHVVGWQLPQLFTARHVSRQKRYKPFVLWMTIQERLPFLFLAILALFVPVLGNRLSLILTFLLLAWQGLGGGFTANAWQSMVAKIFPEKRRGTFLGVQSAAANLLASGGAVFSGIILERYNFPIGFSLCFLATTAAMVISFAFLAMTREHLSTPGENVDLPVAFWGQLEKILRNDANFRWFLVVRMLSQVCMMATAFFTVYAVRAFGMTEKTAGLMTGALMGVQIAANPIMGWVGDRWTHRTVLGTGMGAAVLYNLVAFWAPSLGWFYLVYILAGIANVAMWTTAMTMTMAFGGETERPVYIGMSNTLIAPVAVLAPLFGGWLADASGYQNTFLVSGLGGMAALLVVAVLLRDPRQKPGESQRSVVED